MLHAVKSYVHRTNWAEEPLPPGGFLLNDTIKCLSHEASMSPLEFRGPLSLAEVANSLPVQLHNASDNSEDLLPWHGRHHQDEEHLNKEEGYLEDSFAIMQVPSASVTDLLVLTNAFSIVLVGTVVYRKIQKRSMGRRWEGAAKLPRSGGSNSMSLSRTIPC